MSKVLGLFISLSLASCTLHVHIHEATKEGVPAAAVPSELAHPRGEAGTVSGRVVDERGSPVQARVAAVGESGSISLGTDEDGTFEITGIHWKQVTLHASTKSGLVGFRPRVNPGTAGLDLIVRPGATVTIERSAPEDIRCAVFQQGVRIEDFTLRSGERIRVAVPAGEIQVQIYEGSSILGDATVALDAGSDRRIAFD